MSQMQSKLVYLVDDDKSIRRSLQVALQTAGYDVHLFHDPIMAFNATRERVPDIFLLDVKLGDISGLELYRKLLADGVDSPVVFMSAHASTSEAVEAVKLGAFDFLEKPFTPEKLMITLGRCLELRSVKAEINTLKAQVEGVAFLGQSKLFQDLQSDIRKVAGTNSSVLVIGESGTGKELIAKEIHQQSRVAKGPFVKVNCSAIPESLIESELFGYQKGAFTGADKNKKGYFELADGGTLFLDEIGDMSLAAQAKVLRAIQNSEIQKLGSEIIAHVEVRVIAATNVDLKDAVHKKLFREDLYYRINVFPIAAPPLRERKSDIPVLANHFLREYVRVNSFQTKFLGTSAVEALCAFDWPGNIRELKNVVERMAILGGQTLDDRHVPKSASGKQIKDDRNNFVGFSPSLKDYRNEVERAYIVQVLKQTEGNISEAASILKVERTYLHKRLIQFEIKKREYFL
ncbi:MAG: sigma-54-dependent Fis family transcriptional regulator [Bdellovibrionaceae bacterium]|nr:sigma-54-dependent Fis family transcriptional regulator [Pseudobdellovibrionaceae bacterium]